MSIVVNNWRMDPSLNALIHCETGETRRLGEYHFILLETLAKNADTVLSRSFLMTEVWKNRIVGGNSLPTAIHALRVAIDDDGKQQEIIKTIPKKGYLFNKNYLVITNDHAFHKDIETTEQDVQPVAYGVADDSEAPENEKTNEAHKPLTNKTLSEEKKKRNVSQRSPYRAVFITLPVIAISLFLFVFMYYFKAPFATTPTDVPQLVKEKIDNASQISVYHLHNPDANNTATTLFSQHILPGMQHINPLLIAHNMTMKVYYRESLSKFVLDIVLSNQCNDSWQLALSFDSWQNKDNEMNTIMFKEVEKMLNEIPKCK
ncbi:winged helix-turn-helix domain-containing protein [Citrobacter freundii]|nr:winged helix-turn-helix domain-containing protein [Citrobacter freundii]EMF0721040.1 winged helix-turn-helix domain-containing protein [Citrobacter freundii]